MTRKTLLALLLPSLAILLLAHPAREANPRASMQELETAIHTELEHHGERVMGSEMYYWSTRLERIEDCRAEFSVRLTSKFHSDTVRTEAVNFSLGAIEPYGIDLQKHWLELPCAHGEKCIFSTSRCTATSKEGMVTDCTTPSQKRVDSFTLQLDEDAAAGARLERAFRKAILLCREPAPVTF